MPRYSKFVLTIVFTSLLVSNSFAADITIKPGDQVVEVAVETQEQLRALLDMDLDVWSHEVGVGPIDVHVSVQELEAIEKLGLTYAVKNHDLQASQQAELAGQLARGAGAFDAYMNLATIVDYINGFVTDRPDLCEVFSIGNSLEGRPIWVLHITGAGAGPKPGVFYHGLQHCREWITGPTVLYLANHLVSQYDSDPCIRALVDQTDFYLAPCVNPDGYEYTWIPANRLWRKNRRNNGNGTFGVDLNRNWGYQWGFDNSGSSSSTSSETYRGTGPFSEPETQVLRDFINSHTNIRAYMDYHSYSQLILWPYGYANVLAPEPDRSTFDLVGGKMQSLIQGVHGLAYTAGPIYSTIYPANGGSADWVYGSAGRFGYSIELRDTGESGFLLPADQIIPNCEENLPAILYLSRWASSGILLDLESSPPNTLAAGQSTVLTVRITNSQQVYEPGSGQCHYRFGTSGPYSTVGLSPAGGGLYTATIPPSPCGITVEYYFTASGSEGYVASSPCTAPTDFYSAIATELEVAFADDMESNLGWTVGDTGDNATTGVWNRMNPQGTAAQPEDDHTPGAGSICWVTDGNAGTSVGSFDIDGGKTTLKSPTLNLAGQSNPVISYWRWYSNSAGTAPNADVFTVDISNNNGANWINVETIGPAGAETGGGWFQHEFHVTDFVTPTSTVQLRFVASDLGAGSVVEAAIDDFLVGEVKCSCAIPGDLDGSGTVNGLDMQYFVLAMAQEPYYEACADVASPFDSFVIDTDDVSEFVDLLLSAP